MEGQKNLLKQGVKHSAVFQCCEAFYFLKDLLTISEKFKNKNEMMMALIKIIPPGCRNMDIRSEIQSEALSATDKTPMTPSKFSGKQSQRKEPPSPSLKGMSQTVNSSQKEKETSKSKE
jgi:hypothetical protein